MVMMVAIFLIRKGGLYSRMGFMVLVGIIVRLAEFLNSMGANRWRDFATQNYFDRGGIFMGIMFCAPLLIFCFFVLASMIREASCLLVDVKKMKIRVDEKERKAKAEGRRKKRD